jgi:GNAT superfamily N-acetyltransferase
MAVEIVPLQSLSIDGFEALVEESEAEGVFPLTRLVDGWQAGRNRFDRPGEALFAAVENGRLLGVCGLNRDPYLDDPHVGRVRHLYVAHAARGRGVGGRLVRAVIDAARDRFQRLRLRTDCPIAARFYQSLGFEPVDEESHATHALSLEDATGGRL